MAAPAHADVFNWSYTGTSPTGLTDSGSGTLTTGALTATPPGLFVPPGPGFLITNIAGTWDGVAIANLLPVSPPFGTDNILYPTSTPFMDNGGFSFSVGDGKEVRIFASITFSPPSPDFFSGFYIAFTAFPECCPLVDHTDGDFTVATVPGPIVGAGLPGVILACGVLPALARRRRQLVA